MSKFLVYLLCCSSLTLLNGVQSRHVSEGLTVKLKHGGLLTGRHMESAHGRSILAYLGVPYAKPPIGDLRFSAPVPADSWEGERMAIEESNNCSQVDVKTGTLEYSGDEDCLYLNIFVPQEPKTKRLLPVMVYIHGGYFVSGSSSLTDSNPERFLDRDIIFVTFNYRLGTLGFLSSETLDIPGNFGLKDQVMALKWINDNISAFGGDKNSITIFGEGAGSASVTYHTLSETTKGLFHKAIASSGSFYNSWAKPAPKEVAASQALKIIESVGCGDCGVQENSWPYVLYCLRDLPARNLTEAVLQLYVWENLPTIPFPIVIEPEHEDAYLTHDLQVTEYSNSIPMMIGFAKDEGVGFFNTHRTYHTDWNKFKQQLHDFMPYAFNYEYIPEENEEFVKQAILEFYFENGIVTKSQNLTDVLTDSTILSGIDEHIRHRLSKEYPTAPTYLFQFQHKGELSNSYRFQNDFLGVCFADENFYLFPTGDTNLPTSIPSNRDRELSDNMIDMWYNFAAVGNPSPANTYLPSWDPIDSYPPQSMRIGSLNNEDSLLEMTSEYPEKRAKFWQDLKFYSQATEYKFL